MNYCSQCGEKVKQEIPDGDNRMRHVCPACETIHYENPKTVAGVLPTWKGKVLLCKRAIEPRYGFWTLPAGYMENAESVEEGARREAWEEAKVEMADLQLYTVTSLRHVNQIYMIFLGEMAKEEYDAGTESLDVQLFDEADIPWGELAFATVEKTLKCFFDDRKKGEFQVHNLVYEKPKKS